MTAGVDPNPRVKPPCDIDDRHKAARDLDAKRASVYIAAMKEARPRTIYSMLERYLECAEFRSRSLSVQAEYTRVARHLQREIGGALAVDLVRDDIRNWRDQWSQAGHRAATIRLQVLRNALEPLLADSVLPADLFLRLQRVHRPHGTPEQNPIWLDAEVEAFIAHCIATGADGLARAVALGRWAGLRRQTIIAVLETDRTVKCLRGGQMRRRLQCVSAKGEVLLDIPEDPRLARVLNDLTYGCGDTIAFNRLGMPWKARQLNQALDRVIARLAADEQVRPNLTLHGLRHARGVELAEAGCSDAELAAQLGHADAQTARVYRRQAETRRLADRAHELVTASRQKGRKSLFRGALDPTWNGGADKPHHRRQRAPSGSPRPRSEGQGSGCELGGSESGFIQSAEQLMKTMGQDASGPLGQFIKSAKEGQIRHPCIDGLQDALVRIKEHMASGQQTNLQTEV